MAEYSTPEQRTEMPTEKRMGEIRREGQLFFSRDICVVATLFTGVLIVQWLTKNLLQDISQLMTVIFDKAAEVKELSQASVMSLIGDLVLKIAGSVFIIVLTIAIVGSLTVLVQTGWNIKEKKIDIKFSRLNPIAGFKRIFSVQGFIATAKALLKLVIILPIGFLALRDHLSEFIKLVYFPIPALLVYTGVTSRQVFYQVFYVLVAFALFDFVYGKFQWLRLNKMTKDEVKDEKKAIEGDEATRRRIISKGMQRITQRIKASVPKAHVIITNPTHYAVALKYERGIDDAPIVVAKGRGEIALRIREIAKEAGVPIIERKVLARALYASARVGSIIPNDLFKAVAEVFAYLYRVKTPRKFITSPQKIQQ
jgi:flagellar biosynthetic protein FlhB